MAILNWQLMTALSCSACDLRLTYQTSKIMMETVKHNVLLQLVINGCARELTSWGPYTVARTLVLPCSRKADPSAWWNTPSLHCSLRSSGGLRPSTLRPMYAVSEHHILLHVQYWYSNTYALTFRGQILESSLQNQRNAHVVADVHLCYYFVLTIPASYASGARTPIKAQHPPRKPILAASSVQSELGVARESV